MPVTSRSRTYLLGALLALATGAAYFNSITGQFVFDDIPGIVENPSIGAHRSIGEALTPPGGGNPVAGRPVANLSFAINRAFGGLDVRGYHLANLLIHLGAGLLLFGLVRRTLSQPKMPDWLSTAALPIGFSTALLWLVHPLQTESVTYVIQRTESLAGLFYLLALYGFVRGTEAGAGSRGWLGVGVAACCLGVATKETVATAPLIVLLYDRTFVAGSFREAWRRHGKFHGAMLLSWLLLAWLMWQTGGRGGTALWNENATAWRSLLTQSRAVAGYLQLALWPAPLVFDYGDYPADMVWNIGEVWPQFLQITGLGGVALCALWRWPKAGFLGAWFFVILAPSSSFIPIITQLRAEHRMYLPLAAVVVLAVVLLQRAAGRVSLVIVAVLALILGGMTRARNNDYQSVLSIWADTAQKRPDNARARNNHGLALYQTGDEKGALLEYRQALVLEPDFFDAHLNLAEILLKNGRGAEGQFHLNAAVDLHPSSSNDCNNMSHLFYLTGDYLRAREYLETALRLDPENYEAYNNLACVLVAEGRPAEAISYFQRSIALRSDSWSYYNLGDAFQKMGNTDEARASFAEALRLDPTNEKAAERMRQLDVRP